MKLSIRTSPGGRYRSAPLHVRASHSIQLRGKYPGTIRAQAPMTLSFLVYFLAVVSSILAIAGLANADGGEQSQLIEQEIQYMSSEAGEVFLVWGIDNWKSIREQQRPAGTFMAYSAMQSPMLKREDGFAVALHVNAGTVIDFGFLITRTKDGVDVNVWDSSGPYHERAYPNHVIQVLSHASFLQSGKAQRDKWNSWTELVITLACFFIPLWAAILFVRERHEAWRYRVRLPAFRQPRRPSRVGDAAFLGISVLVGIGVSEVVLHIMDPYGGRGAAQELEWVRRGGEEIEKSFRVDPILGLRPRLDYGPYNEHGTLNNAYAFIKPADTHRILVLGGKAVFEGQLVEAFRHLYPREGVEIWNGGIPSYGTVQTINFYNQYQSKIQPDKVILFIASRDLETTPIAYRDSNNSIVAYAPYMASTSLNRSLFAVSHIYRLVVGLVARLNDSEKDFLQEMRASLSELAISLQKDHKDFLVVVLPLLYPEDMWSYAEKERRKAILSMFNGTDIRYVDLLPAFRTAIRENLDLRQHAGNPFEPSETLAKHFGVYLQKHGFAGNMDLRAAEQHEHH